MKKRIENPEENRAIFLNVHEAIIDRPTWEKVQNMKKGTRRRRPTVTQEPSVFSGVLKCPECGGNLNFHFNQGNHAIKFFSCQNHNSGLRKCSKTHYIRLEFLERVVLYEVNRLACFANEYEDDFIKAMMGRSAKLTTLNIQKFYNRTRESGRIQRYKGMEGSGLSNKTIRSLHAMLRQCLDQAVMERLIPSNPAANCKLPPKEKKEMQIIPPEKLGDYLRAAKEHGVLPMFYLELTTGLRRGELLALFWTDLNIKEKCLTVSKSVARGKGELRVTEPKTKNSVRTVYIDNEAIRLLVEDRKNHPFSPYLFPSQVTGGMYGPDCVGRIHKKLLKRAGIEEHVRFHDLRRTFATMALQNGVDIKTVSGMLGHYSAEFTLDVYTNVTKEMQKDAAKKIGGFMAEVM